MLKNWRMWMLIGLCPFLNGCVLAQVVLFSICVGGLVNLEIPEPTARELCGAYFITADECLEEIAFCERKRAQGLPCTILGDCIPLGGSSSFLSESDLLGNASEPVFPFPAKTHLPYGEPANFMLTLGNDMAGQSTSLQASFATAFDRLQTHQERFIVPAAFGFAGFTALGPANTQICFLEAMA